jgi:hypothetical protein
LLASYGQQNKESGDGTRTAFTNDAITLPFPTASPTSRIGVTKVILQSELMKLS